MHLEQKTCYFNLFTCKTDTIKGTDKNICHRSYQIVWEFWSEQIYLQND